MKLGRAILAVCALVAVGSARASGDGINAIRTAFPFAVDGDPFDSYDTSKGGASASDYNCAYRNPRTGSIAPSRRLEAWYQGLVDFKIVKWCRQRIAERTAKGEDLSKVKSGLDSLVKEADSPRCDYVKIRARLSAIAESLAGSRKD